MNTCNQSEKQRRLEEMKWLLQCNRTATFVQLFDLAKTQLPWTNELSQSSLYRYVFEVRRAEDARAKRMAEEARMMVVKTDFTT